MAPRDPAQASVEGIKLSAFILVGDQIAQACRAIMRLLFLRGKAKKATRVPHVLWTGPNVILSIPARRAVVYVIDSS